MFGIAYMYLKCAPNLRKVKKMFCTCICREKKAFTIVEKNFVTRNSVLPRLSLWFKTKFRTFWFSLLYLCLVVISIVSIVISSSLLLFEAAAF